MMYYIDRPSTWKAANRKCAEIHEYVEQFKNTLIKDDLSRDALIEDLRLKVEEFNAAYPRTKKLVVRFDFGDFISCYPEEQYSDSDYVFTINLRPVRRTYRFAEQTAFLDEVGGEEKVDARENIIQNITNLLRVSPFTVDFEVKKNPKGIRIINEVTQEHMNEIMAKAKEGGDR